MKKLKIENPVYDFVVAWTNKAFALLHWLVSLILFWLFKGAGVCVGKLPWSSRLGLLNVILGGILFRAGFDFIEAYSKWAELTSTHLQTLKKLNAFYTFDALSMSLIGIGALMLLLSLLSSLKLSFIHFFMKIAASAAVILWGWLYLYIIDIPSSLHLADDKVFDKTMRDDLWIFGTAWWLVVFIALLLLLLCLSYKRVCEFYSKQITLPTLFGDKVEENLVTHGDDPKFRKSSYWSMFLHFFILFLYPLMWRGCMMEPYKMPKGSGSPVTQMVKIKKVKKPKQDQIVFNMNSAISFYKPDIDESEVMEEVDEATEDKYEASDLKSGKLGAGGGKSGGWPAGMEDAKVRFIRLKYSGGDWDQDMGVGSDYNFLIKFKEMTGFNIASNTEAIDVFQLGKFPKHRAPPFVYITGKGGINMSRKDIKTLRNYCLVEGGMIFADNGGGRFHGSFKNLMRKVFPELPWITISNDDGIFRQPYSFPNGAPALQHHSGHRALGIKHNGRYVVFYHQGDINDAWKSGVVGLSPAVQMQAFKMGINVVNYAFSQYSSLHSEN